MADDNLNSGKEIPTRIFRLGEEPGENIHDSTTAEQRLEMVFILSQRMWQLTGQPIPQYGRSEIPVRIIRESRER